jgi:hypothetical protein
MTKGRNNFGGLTNGNDAILKGQIDLKIPGGTYSTSPVYCTTVFTLIVLSNLSSALHIENHMMKNVFFSNLPVVQKNIRCPYLYTRNSNCFNITIVFWFPC